MCWIPFTLNTTSLVPCRSLRNLTVKLQQVIGPDHAKAVLSK